MRKYAVPAALLLTAVLAAGCGSAAPATTETTAAVEETKEAEETKAEEKAEAEEEAKASVAFAGIDNPAVKAAADWLAGFAAENLKSGEGMIPVMSLAKLDDSDEKDVKLYGTYDMNSYTVDGSVLKIDETKRLTGVMHMEKDGDAYKVSNTEWAEDGSNVKSALKKIVTDENMYNEMANGTISPELKTWYIGEAVKALGLSVDSYQEKGGQPVSLSQEPKKAAEWVEKLAAGIEGDQFVTVGKTAGSNAVLMLHEKASNGGWNTILSAPALIGRNGLGGEDAGEGTTKTGLSDLKVDDLQAFGQELATSGGIAVPKDILDMLKKGVKQDCKLVVDTEENILNGTAVQTPKGLLATAMEKVSYGEKLTEEERMAIADALEESLAGNYLGDAARYACSYTASYGIPMRDGEVDYLALSAESFPTEIKTTKGTVPFTIGRMRADDVGSGAQVPETLRFTAADGSTVDAYTLWTNGGCIGELIQSDGTYGIFETEDGRYTLEKLNDNTEAETAAAETTAAESPAEETLQKDAAANAASPAAATTAAAQTTAQTAKADLPDYSYTGTGNAAIMNAITDYMEKMASQYGAADVMIPNIQVVGVDDSNPNDVKVYGDFWVMNYNLTGKTLENTAGGSYPGLMHLAQTAAGYVVTRFESADDGSSFQESLERICADHPEMANALLNSEFNDDLRLDTIKNYVKSNGLDIDFFKDYGWDPVAVD